MKSYNISLFLLKIEWYVWYEYNYYMLYIYQRNMWCIVHTKQLEPNVLFKTFGEYALKNSNFFPNSIVWQRFWADTKLANFQLLLTMFHQRIFVLERKMRTQNWIQQKLDFFIAYSQKVKTVLFHWKGKLGSKSLSCTINVHIRLHTVVLFCPGILVVPLLGISWFIVASAIIGVSSLSISDLGIDIFITSAAICL